jgi:two-component sensor histidine kinase
MICLSVPSLPEGHEISSSADSDDRRVACLEKKLCQSRKRASTLLAELAAAHRSAADAKLLVKEVDHRAKNSLQLAAAMLDQQARRANDEVRAELASAIRRLETLASIHAALYTGEDADTLCMRDWLKRICFAFDPPSQIAVSIEAPDIDWPAPLVRTLGLFSSEAIANALKYAFPNGVAGRLSVRIAPVADGYWGLEVADDGVGRVEDIQEGLGWRLLRTFVRQLRGELRLSVGLGGRGVAVSLVFPVSAEVAPALL